MILSTLQSIYQKGLEEYGLLTHYGTAPITVAVSPRTEKPKIPNLGIVKIIMCST
jgi:hypothetical protein